MKHFTKATFNNAYGLCCSVTALLASAYACFKVIQQAEQVGAMVWLMNAPLLGIALFLMAFVLSMRQCPHRFSLLTTLATASGVLVAALV